MWGDRVRIRIVGTRQIFLAQGLVDCRFPQREAKGSSGFRISLICSDRTSRKQIILNVNGRVTSFLEKVMQTFGATRAGLPPSRLDCLLQNDHVFETRPGTLHLTLPLFNDFVTSHIGLGFAQEMELTVHLSQRGIVGHIAGMTLRDEQSIVVWAWTIADNGNCPDNVLETSVLKFFPVPTC